MFDTYFSCDSKMTPANITEMLTELGLGRSDGSVSYEGIETVGSIISKFIYFRILLCHQRRSKLNDHLLISSILSVVNYDEISIYIKRNHNMKQYNVYFWRGLGSNLAFSFLAEYKHNCKQLSCSKYRQNPPCIDSSVYKPGRNV